MKITVARITLPLLFFAAMLSACAVAPVQEMSNARQAVEAARQVGAPAGENLDAAQAYLRRAEQALSEGKYQQAREDAEAARRKAVEAQAVAQDNVAPSIE